MKGGVCEGREHEESMNEWWMRLPNLGYFKYLVILSPPSAVKLTAENNVASCSYSLWNCHHTKLHYFPVRRTL